LNNAILINTQSAVIICHDSDSATEYIRGLIDEGIQRNNSLKLSIETRPESQVKAFLYNAQPASIPEKPKAAAAASPQKKYVSTASKPSGKSNPVVVLECIIKLTEKTALNVHEICGKTGLAMESISPMLTGFFKDGKISRVEGKPLKFYKK